MSTKHRAQTRRDKRPAKKRTRRIKVEVGPVVEDRRKALGLPSFFEDKKQLAQARRVIETRGVSRQQERNTLYAYQAYTVLEGAKGAGLDPRYRFLWDERGAEQTSWAKKPTLLAELGRLGDAKKIRDVAKVLCEYQPSTTVAVTVIRAVRVGRRALWSPTRILDGSPRQYAANAAYVSHIGFRGDRGQSFGYGGGTEGL